MCWGFFEDRLLGMGWMIREEFLKEVIRKLNFEISLGFG